MIWNAARGGMRAVVERYLQDQFISKQNIRLIASYSDAGFIARQVRLARALFLFTFLLLRNDIELVHCHVAMRGSFWRKSIFAIIARAFHTPVLLHLHGSEMESFYNNQNRFVRRVIAVQLERATQVLVLSNSWKEFVVSVAPLARAVVVRNYVHVPRLLERSERPTVDLLFTGVLAPRKGIQDLLRALRRARERFPSIRLTVAGDGELERAKSLAAELNVEDCCRFLGWIDEDVKNELLRASDIYVLPSYNEGLPMGLLEAMAYGLPVVTTPVGGIPEIVNDGVQGLLVEPGNLDQLASAILALTEDPALRIRMGRAAHEVVRRDYSADVVLPILNSVYANASLHKT